MSEFSLILVLQKENKQNSNMTWQKYKLNLRNSHLLEEPQIRADLRLNYSKIPATSEQME